MNFCEWRGSRIKMKKNAIDKIFWNKFISTLNWACNKSIHVEVQTMASNAQKLLKFLPVELS